MDDFRCHAIRVIVPFVIVMTYCAKLSVGFGQKHGSR